MEPFQQRVIDEKLALDEKLTKLTAFCNDKAFHELDMENKELLIRQEYLMREYSLVLSERIAGFIP